MTDTQHTKEYLATKAIQDAIAAVRFALGRSNDAVYGPYINDPLNNALSALEIALDRSAEDW